MRDEWMYCGICGSEVNNGEMYCPVCGAGLLQSQVNPYEEMKTTSISETPTTRVTIKGDKDNLTFQQVSEKDEGYKGEKVSKHVKAQFSDTTVIRCKAMMNNRNEQFAFDKDGIARKALEPGKWKLTIESDGYDPYITSVEIIAGETALTEVVELTQSINWREAYVSYLKKRRCLILKRRRDIRNVRIGFC